MKQPRIKAKRIYTAANADKLQPGAVGYFADTIGELTAQVEQELACQHVFRRALPDNKERRLLAANGSTWALFYLIKNKRA